MSNGLTLSQRNPPTLFGLGLIDSVPDQIIRDAERREFGEFPEVGGRAYRLPDGRLGRFGWREEIASLATWCYLNSPTKLASRFQAITKPSFHPGQARKPRDSICPSRTAIRSWSMFGTWYRPPSMYLQETSSRLTPHKARNYSPRVVVRTATSPRPAVPIAFTATCCCTKWERCLLTQAIATTHPTPPLARSVPRNGGHRRSGDFAIQAPTFTMAAPDLEDAVAFHAGESIGSTLAFFKLPLADRLRIQMFVRSIDPPSLLAGNASPNSKAVGRRYSHRAVYGRSVCLPLWINFGVKLGSDFRPVPNSHRSRESARLTRPIKAEPPGRASGR